MQQIKSNTASKIFSGLVFVFLFFTLLALLSSSVSAFENYQLTAPFSPVVVASCAQNTETLQLKNAGDEAAQLQLSFTDNKVAQIARLVPDKVFLAPGQSQTITIFLAAPCTLQGSFDYSIAVKGNTQTQIFDRRLEINKVSNLDFVATAGNVLKSCPCVPQKIPFTITNTGTWPEVYTVSASGYQEDVAVPQDKIFLGPGQTFSGAAFTAFSCQTYGQKNFDLQVEAQNSQYKATIPIEYDISACYDYTLGSPQNVTVCEQDTKEIAGIINNTADYINTFKISSYLPNFASQAGNQVTLLPKQIGIAPIELAPQAGDAGAYQYTVQTSSVLGNLFDQSSGTINVLSCYNYDISTNGGIDKFAVCPPGESLVFTITNNGQLPQEMHVNSSDARFVASPSVFNLSAGASRQVTLSVPASGLNGLTQKESFALNVWSTANPQVIASKQVTLQPDDLQTCFGVQVSPVVYEVNNSPTNLSVKVTSTGIRDSVYNLTLVGPPWTQLLQQSVFVPAHGTGYVGIAAAAPVYVENTSFAANLTLATPYSVQTVPVLFDLNPQAAQWLLWFLGVAVLLLLALMIILLAARSSRMRKIDMQSAAAKQPQKPLFATKREASQAAKLEELRAKLAEQRKDALRSAKAEAARIEQIEAEFAQKLAAARQAAKLATKTARKEADAKVREVESALAAKIEESKLQAKLQAIKSAQAAKSAAKSAAAASRKSEKSEKLRQADLLSADDRFKWILITIIVLIVIAVIIILTVTTVQLNHLSQLANESNQSNITQPNVTSTNTTATNATVAAQNVTQVNVTQANVTQVNVTQANTSQVTGSEGAINATTNATQANVSQNISQVNVTVNATQNASENAAAGNESAQNASTNQQTSWWSQLWNDLWGMNPVQNATTNASNATANVTESVMNSTAAQAGQAQRALELATAKQFLSQNENNPRVFEMQENETGLLNLSHYFVDPDNLSLSFEIIPVNATKMVTYVHDDQLLLTPQSSFVGMQTFRIKATNTANLSSTSPLFTVAVIDKLPSAPLPDSVQFGLLILLIIIVVIIYFDIRLISRQYERARAGQEDHQNTKDSKDRKRR